MPNLSPFSIESLIASILANLMTDVVQQVAGEQLDNTKVGQWLKKAGLIERTFYDQLHDILATALKDFFNNPAYQVDGIAEFIISPAATYCLKAFLVEGTPPNDPTIVTRFEQIVIVEPEMKTLVRRRLLTPRAVYTDFIRSLVRALIRQVSPGDLVISMQIKELSVELNELEGSLSIQIEELSTELNRIGTSLHDELQQLRDILQEAGLIARREEEEAFQSYLHALDIYSANFPYLTIYSSLTKEPKSLDEIFVKPILKSIPKESKDKKDEPFVGDPDVIIKRVFSNQSSKHLFIRSQPGSGKSTLLRWITKHACGNPTEVGLKRSCMPLTIRLQHFAVSEGISVEDRLRNSLSKASDLALSQNLPAGFWGRWPQVFKRPWIIMFDGLDEIPAIQYPTVMQWLENFIKVADEHQYHVVITSRETHRLTSKMEERFVTCEILPFDKPQQHQFLEKWFSDWTEQKIDTFLDDLSNLQEEALNGTPLLLTIAVTVYERDEKLPATRINLYNRYISICIDEAAQHGLKDELGNDMFDIVEPALENIAFAATEEPDDISQDAASSALSPYLCHALNYSQDIATIRSKRFVDILGKRSGFFILQDGICEWLHPTFREFLAARLVVRQYFDERGCINVPEVQRLAEVPVSSELWHFVIELLEQVEDLGEMNWEDFCLVLLKYEFSFALRYYRKVKAISQDYVIRAEIEDDLISIMNFPLEVHMELEIDDYYSDKNETINILGYIGSQKAIDDILESAIGNTWSPNDDGETEEDYSIPSSDHYEENAAKFALARIGGDYIINQILLLTYLTDDYYGMKKVLKNRNDFGIMPYEVLGNAIESLGLLFDERCIRRLLELADESAREVELSNYHLIKAFGYFMLVDLRQIDYGKIDEKQWAKWYRSYISRDLKLIKRWSWINDAVKSIQIEDDGWATVFDNYVDKHVADLILSTHFNLVDLAHEDEISITDHVVARLTTLWYQSRKLREKWGPEVEKRLVYFAIHGDEDAIGILSKIDTVSSIDKVAKAIFSYDFDQYEYSPRGWIFPVIDKLTQRRKVLPLIYIHANCGYDASFDALQQIGPKEIEKNLRKVLDEAKSRTSRRKWAKIIERATKYVFYKNSAITLAICHVAEHLAADSDVEVANTFTKVLEEVKKLTERLDDNEPNDTHIDDIPF